MSELPDAPVDATEAVAILRAALSETRAALIEAQNHIQNDLQPEFEKLAGGEMVTRPESYTGEQAFMRLATWWHGVGTDSTIQKAASALEATVDIGSERDESSGYPAGIVEGRRQVVEYLRERSAQLLHQAIREGADGDPDKALQLKVLSAAYGAEARELSAKDGVPGVDQTTSLDQESAARRKLSNALKEVISQVVGTYYTDKGVQSWWERERHQLGGKTPAQVLDTDPKAVMDLAHAGREQGGS